MLRRYHAFLGFHRWLRALHVLHVLDSLSADYCGLESLPDLHERELIVDFEAHVQVRVVLFEIKELVVAEVDRARLDLQRQATRAIWSIQVVVVEPGRHLGPSSSRLRHRQLRILLERLETDMRAFLCLFAAQVLQHDGLHKWLMTLKGLRLLQLMLELQVLDPASLSLQMFLERL